MKTLILNLVLFLSYATGFAQSDEKPYLSKSLGTAVKSVNMQTSVGALTVTGSDEKEVRIEVFVKRGGGKGDETLSPAEIEQRLKDDYTLTMEMNGSELVALAKPRHRLNNRELSISFVAHVPKTVKTELQTSVGAIVLENLQGQLNAKTSVGAISASGCDGTLRLTTSVGAISVTKSRGDAEAVTSTGSVKAEDFSGKILAKSSTGSVELNRISGSVEAASSTGSARVQMASIDQYVKVNVSIGSVNLDLPASKGLDLDLAARKVNAETLNNFSGTREKNRIEGKLNGGGASVEARTSMGSITLALN